MDKVEVTQADRDAAADFLDTCSSGLDTENILSGFCDSIPTVQAFARHRQAKPEGFRWPIDAKVRKKRGSQWRGTVCGFYSTPHTPEGYCVVSDFETGSVQVWPAEALEDWETPNAG